ncbi:hypothetical protein I350_03210 [Cryptococcus amylolentus CBS 6273]|uniref:ribonuclease Z n=1 Tax=Cryptococcus amylolentus CBS 6273 TaxID=1296118 RepID=A0A1E3KBG5_9TREE|nr:hypothetical protein I350_03210 [Cryptococcus amylolentus CBS 6273]
MQRTETYSPNWFVRAVTAPGPDTDLCLHVSFDNAKFIFGAGEGTQRAYAQKKIGFGRLAGVFVNSGESKGRGGLPGIIMSAADAGIKTINVVGPPDLTQDSLTLNASPYPRDAEPGTPINLFTSPNMTVRSIVLFPPPPPHQRSPPTYDPYTPLGPVFRPSRLSPVDLQRWCGQVVSDMFQNNSTARLSQRAPSPPFSPGNARTRSEWASANVYLSPDGTINAARPDTRAPLPTPSETDVNTQMVYILETPDVRGKFDNKRAGELGVPNGPLRGKLTRGEVIEFPDPEMEGVLKTVRPEECLVGGGPGAVMILVSCTLKTLPDLLRNKTFAEYQPLRETPGQSARKVHLMVHRIPREVLADEGYKEWMRAFGPETQHLIADTTPTTSQTVFNSAAWATLNLSHLDSSIFHPPLLHPTPTPTSSLSLSPSLAGFLDLPPKTKILEPNHFCRMHPLSDITVFPWNEKDVPFTVGPEEVRGKARERVEGEYPEYAEACRKAQEAVRADPRWEEVKGGEPGDDLVITTLGTGSAIPSKYRNVSSTLLTIPPPPTAPDAPDTSAQSILLDAGEGTLGQLRRRFGKEGELEGVLRGLGAVFVSHMHADHHLGVNAILEERFRVWQMGITTPLYVIAPQLIALNLRETATWQSGASDEGLGNVKFIAIERLGERVALGDELEYVGRTTATTQHANIQSFLSSLSLTSLHAPRVWHRGRAFGLVLQHSSGWKLVYSGDTKPCAPLVEAGKGATVLIHEATLEDDKPEVAAVKGHSTFGQAVDVGKQMGAKYILLNHFSQRYPKLPKMPGVVPLAVAEEASESARPTRKEGVPEEILGEAFIEEDVLENSSTETLAPLPENVVLDASSEPSDPPVLPSVTPTAPTIDDTSSNLPPPSTAPPHVSISFDFMSLRLADMWKMPYYMDALSILFAEPEEAEVEDGAGSVGEGKVNGAGTGTGEQGGVTGAGKGKRKKAEKREKKQAQKAAEGEAKSQGPGQGQGGEVKSKRALKKELANAQREKQARKSGEGKRDKGTLTGSELAVESLVVEDVVVEEAVVNEVDAKAMGAMEIEEKEAVKEVGEKRAGSLGIEEPEAKRRSVDDQ